MNRHTDFDGLPVIGWREWVALPDLGVTTIKAKVDTGARTSSLHAFDMEEFVRRGRDWIRFQIHPVQRARTPSILTEAPIHEWRHVKPSSGHVEYRPVISTQLELLGQVFEIELTLTRRDAMGFRMLLGREATRRRFLVDPGRSFLNGQPRRKKKTVKKKTKKGRRP